MENVTQLPTPDSLTAEQRQHWYDQAAYWGVKQDDSARALEYATNQRNYALGMLGMISIEGPSGTA